MYETQTQGVFNYNNFVNRPILTIQWHIMTNR